jgi:hypothetical protein
MLFLAFFLPAHASVTPASEGMGVFTETVQAIGRVDAQPRWRGVEATLARHDVEAVARALLSAGR